MKRSLMVLCGVFLSTLAFAQPILKVSAIPDEAPTELQRKFAPLGKYLESEIGLKVEFTPVSDYAAVVEALASENSTWRGSVASPSCRRDCVPMPIPLFSARKIVFTSKFIANSASGINSLNDLKGKNFSFGSVSLLRVT
jgi:phosphonate transport system substrate-binding protein